ncbi:MAG TPA: low affinity iron permease family protein [Allosphingosinicella sp.]|nr:low affinity iron permease family protein [Allosphingosinicella sp.]
MTQEEGRLEALGCRISEKVADVSAHPFAQLALVLGCAAWFALAWRVDWLTAALSILAITLTQMVLNRQHEREKEAHRRDLALHAKLDELVLASRRARDELAGIEELEEEEIEELKAAAPASGDSEARQPSAATGGEAARPARRAA